MSHSAQRRSGRGAATTADEIRLARLPHSRGPMKAGQPPVPRARRSPATNAAQRFQPREVAMLWLRLLWRRTPREALSPTSFNRE
jgi:hypothetical protein